jgi:hypothetical protein
MEEGNTLCLTQNRHGHMRMNTTMQKKRGEHENRMERQRARRKLDAKGVDRTGKDVSHTKSLAKGGKNKDGYKLENPAKNRARNGHKKGEKKT